MPRAFDSDEITGPLSFFENVTCDCCGETFEGLFTDYSGSQSVEELTVPPLGRHTCDECGYNWSSVMTGWMFFTEAG